MVSFVRCVICGRPVWAADADIVGLGYRCADCALRAQIDGSEESAHLTPAERALVPRDPSLGALVLAGVGLLALATVLWIYRIDLSLGGPGLFGWVFFLGIGALGTAWFRWLDRRS